MREVLLSAKNITVGYTNEKTTYTLFENITLELRAGELVCFMGANGVGKSTLIRTLAGLQKPLSAATIAGSVPVSPYSAHKKGIAGQAREGLDGIAVVLTDRINAVNMTVYELVTYGRYPYLDWNVTLHEHDITIINNAISLTHIDHLKNKKLFELSDGQLQLVMIARALAQDTAVILLDEPTAHLDLNNRVEIMNLLRTLSRTLGKAILVATHELDLALQTADLIWLATRDHQIITGIPEDLVLNGSFDQTFQFKGFDLKTGKVHHDAWRNRSVNVVGEGFEYLWTKNALERNGYLVDETAATHVTVHHTKANLTWTLGLTTLNSIREVIDALSSMNSDTTK